MEYGLLSDLVLDDDGKLPAWAWPGGYPILYTDSDNEVLCPDCAYEALADPDEIEQFKPKHFFIFYEGANEFCASCNREIESAYGDPFENEEEN